MPAFAATVDLHGEWVLRVETPAHQVAATLHVRFTDRPADSCMAGDWKVADVVSAASRLKGFFPAADPLAWRAEDGRLTIGRNQICDAYLWLQGALDAARMQGDYFRLGLDGGSPLGRFTLRPAG